jgi:hypothetical protein
VKRFPLVFVFLILTILTLNLRLDEVKAQAESEWTVPSLLSSGQGHGSNATLIADKYGFIHAFWSEELENEQTLLVYSRFDGSNWSVPTDLYITRPFIPIKNISVTISPDDRLYVMWPEGDEGPAYFFSASLAHTLSTQDWEKPYLVSLHGNIAEFRIDAKGVFHVVYSRITSDERGVFYIRSDDQGISWTSPLWLDPDILSDHMPSDMSFVLDEDDGLHVTWFYYSTEFGGGGDWVRYVHSLDGGKSWSTPFTIDRLDQAEILAGEELSNAAPVLVTNGEQVHVIWAGGTLHYRHHRYSEDRGQTWSQSTRILGELNGAAGDGAAVDGAGRLHYFSQIRFPQGIYHAVWDNHQWAKPHLIYLIRYSDEDDIGNRIHAHTTYPIIRAGNQIILTLTDPPPEVMRRLFFMQTTLTDIPVTSFEPTPTPTAVPTQEVTSTPTPVPATPLPSFGAAPLPPASGARPDRAVWLGVAPVLLLVLGAIGIYYIRIARIR